MRFIFRVTLVRVREVGAHERLPTSPQGLAVEPSSCHPSGGHGYYEKPGVRSFAVDKDKRVIAKIIGHFAATRCLELGCATGPVLKLLCEARIDAQDVEVSHLALALASPLIRKRTADSFSVGRS